MASAVLFSGGLDSAVLLADEAARGEVVHPVYVGAGLAWEPPERAAAEAFLATVAGPHVRPLVALHVDMRDVYAATHWAVQGRPPAYDTPDEDVYLPGRNIILLAKTAVYAAAAGIARIVVGTLAHNPFPDATPEFRDAVARAVSLGLACPIAIAAPYADVEKADVIRRGAAMRARLDLTLSCMNPQGFATAVTPTRASAVHCGACSKCRERHDAFIAAGVADPTVYAVPPPR